MANPGAQERSRGPERPSELRRVPYAAGCVVRDEQFNEAVHVHGRPQRPCSKRSGPDRTNQGCARPIAHASHRLAFEQVYLWSDVAAFAVTGVTPRYAFADPSLSADEASYEVGDLRTCRRPGRLSLAVALLTAGARAELGVAPARNEKPTATDAKLSPACPPLATPLPLPARAHAQLVRFQGHDHTLRVTAGR
jgi:hypothetical protein